jgi:hypothetical protein
VLSSLRNSVSFIAPFGEHLEQAVAYRLAGGAGRFNGLARMQTYLLGSCRDGTPMALP